MSNFYHGTRAGLEVQINKEGLKRGIRSGVFITESLKAAKEYAELAARINNDQPLVYKISLGEIEYQPNGSPRPPFYIDDWHNQSMPGKAWEYDAVIPPELLERL